MSELPASTATVVSIETAEGSKVRIMMELICDADRLAEVSRTLLHKAIEQKITERGAKLT